MANKRWNSPFSYKLTSDSTGVLLSELGKLLFKSNILHITSYFIMDIVYYSYILLKIQCNLLILHIKLLNRSNLIIITLYSRRQKKVYVA